MRILGALVILIGVSPAYGVTFGSDKGPKGLFNNGPEASGARKDAGHRPEAPATEASARPPAGPEASLSKRERAQLADLERILRNSGSGQTLAQLRIRQDLGTANCLIAAPGAPEPTAKQARDCLRNNLAETEQTWLAAKYPGYAQPPAK